MQASTENTNVAIIHAIDGQDCSDPVSISMANCSPDCVAFLHNAPVEVGTECSMEMIDAQGENCHKKGSVFECMRVNDHMFEIFVRPAQN